MRYEWIQLKSTHLYIPNANTLIYQIYTAWTNVPTPTKTNPLGQTTPPDSTPLASTNSKQDIQEHQQNVIAGLLVIVDTIIIVT